MPFPPQLHRHTHTHAQTILVSLKEYTQTNRDWVLGSISQEFGKLSIYLKKK